MSRNVIQPQNRNSVNKINIIVGFMSAESRFSVAGQFGIRHKNRTWYQNNLN